MRKFTKKKADLRFFDIQKLWAYRLSKGLQSPFSTEKVLILQECVDAYFFTLNKTRNYMVLGIGYFGDLRIEGNKIQSAQQRMQEIIEEIKLMDESGLDYFAMGEHHRPDYAVSVPEIVLAAAAGITSKITLSSGVSVLSSSDPVRLYQSFATLDLIANGRVELMAGRGSFTESFPLYGYDLKDYNELFEEKLALLLQINKENPITWKGKFRPALDAQQVLPRASKDHLKIWIAVGGTPESVLRAARLGLPVMFAIIGGNPKNFKPLFDYYKEMYLKFGHPEDKMQTGVHMHGLVGKDSQAVADYYFPIYGGQMNRIGRSRGWPPYSRNQYDLGRSSDGHLLIGNAQEAIEKINTMKELFGINRFVMHMDVGAPDHGRMKESIEILGKEIAPLVK